MNILDTGVYFVINIFPEILLKSPYRYRFSIAKG